MIGLRKTYQPKAKDISRTWHVVSADGEVLGRLATRVAVLLSGKGKRGYAPHFDGGDVVVVTNAAGIRLTGKKPEQKIYYRHGVERRAGSLKEIPFRRLFEKSPEAVVRSAVYGMLPKNKLRDQMMKRLKVYRGAEHPHAAQLSGKKKKERT